MAQCFDCSTLTHFLKWIKDTEQQNKKKHLSHAAVWMPGTSKWVCAFLYVAASSSGRMQITTLHYRIQEIEDVWKDRNKPHLRECF